MNASPENYSFDIQKIKDRTTSLENAEFLKSTQI